MCVRAHFYMPLQGVAGQAHDRHMLGMLLLAKQEAAASGGAGNIPDIFTDPAFAKMQHIVLSTSQVLTNCCVCVGGGGG